MMSYPDLGYPEGTDAVFSSIDAGEQLLGDFASRGDAGGETCSRGPCMYCKSQVSCCDAHLCFRELGLDEGRDDTRLFLRGLVSWTMTREVRGIGPFDDHVQSLLIGNAEECREQELLADITAIFGIGAIAWIVEFLRFQKLMPNATLAAEVLDKGAIAFGKACRYRGYSEDPIV